MPGSVLGSRGRKQKDPGSHGVFLQAGLAESWLSRILLWSLGETRLSFVVSPDLGLSAHTFSHTLWPDVGASTFLAVILPRKAGMTAWEMGMGLKL